MNVVDITVFGLTTLNYMLSILQIFNYRGNDYISKEYCLPEFDGVGCELYPRCSVWVLCL